MVEHRLDATFKALSDPTRRGMLASLALGDKSVGELGEPFAMTFAGAAKHVKVLESAGLIARRKAGRRQSARSRRIRLRRPSLAQAVGAILVAASTALRRSSKTDHKEK